jgi:hypothetical protein
MTEPVVPVINPAILKTKPKPSGACPSKAALLMFLAGPAIAVICGVVAHYLGIAVGWLGGIIAALPTLLTSICGFVMCMGVIFAIIVILAVVFGYPAVVGVVMGLITAALGKKGNCRNPAAAGLAGALAGIFAYAGHVLIGYLVAGTFSIMTINASDFAEIFDITSIRGTPWWMFALMVIELAIVVIAAGWSAKDENQNDLFCEPHGVWYDAWKEANYALDLAPAIAETLEASQVRGLENVNFVEATTYPNLKISSRRCPSSTACELQFKVALNWQETTVDKKGQQKTENQVKVWVDTMLTPSLGFAIENALRLDEAKTAKKQKTK